VAGPRKPLKDRGRQAWHDLMNGGRFTCGCCPGRQFRGTRALNAHHAARHAGRWAGKQARAAARRMGKDVDAARRHARGWLEAAGLRDHRGRRTDRARSRPELRGKVTRRQLRELHRHDRDHERAAARDRRADRAGARAAAHRQRAENLRSRWPQRIPPAARPAPARVPASANGHHPPVGRTPPQGRLAPSRPARTR
jgi:hypothetical protein